MPTPPQKLSEARRNPWAKGSNLLGNNLALDSDRLYVVMCSQSVSQPPMSKFPRAELSHKNCKLPRMLINLKFRTSIINSTTTPVGEEWPGGAAAPLPSSASSLS
jgi:hypothetical protein